MLTVEFRIKEGILLDYLAYLCPVDKTTGRYQVSSTSDLGKLLIAYARVSERYVPLLPGDREKVITLQLPLSNASRSMNDRWLYYEPQDMLRLQSVLKATLNMDLISYYLNGKSRGLQKKEIIEMFIVSRNLINVCPYEAMHKRVYRSEQRKMAEQFRLLERKARYFEESIDTTGLL